MSFKKYNEKNYKNQDNGTCMGDAKFLTQP